MNWPRLLWPMALAVVAATIVVGVAEGAEGTSTVSVSIQLSDTAMRVSAASVQVGRVRFVVQNRSSVRRDLEVVGTGRTRLLAPGAKTSLDVTLSLAVVKTLRSVGVAGKGARVLKGRLRVISAEKATAVPRVKLTLVGNGFDSPTFVVAPPGDSSRLMVVQQDGVVSLLKNGILQAKPFLDLRSVVKGEGEKGLLSIAFAPDYETSGFVYAYFNNRDGNIRVVEYRRSASDPDLVDPSQRRRLLALTKPTADHNGGMMQFGPDGNLYISIGDGGANPPTIPVGVTGQTLDDLFGSILRIDPRQGSPYAIPPGNPFAAVPGARPEIVAYGLRNPWRFSIDAKTNQMLIGDVGEGTREEIDRLPLGKLGANFGWPCKEGTATPPGVSIPSSCKTAALTPPLWQYPHSASRCSIIGGVTNRDPRLPKLDGLFLWADFCDDNVYALDPTATKPTVISLSIGIKQPTSFGTDAQNRIYLTTVDGSLYRIDPA